MKTIKHADRFCKTFHEVTGVAISPVIVKEFEGAMIPFRPLDDTLWLSGREVGEILEYESPSKRVAQLFKKHNDEFDSDCVQVRESRISENGPPVRERLFSLDGLNLLCMFSEQPKSRPFRKWLRKLATEVQVKGYHVEPGAEFAALDAIVAKLAPLLEAQMLALTHHTERIAAIETRLSDSEERAARTFIPAAQDNSFWPTPTERLRLLVDNSRIPKGFNRGGSFDAYASQRHANTRSGLLSLRNRRHIGKMPDYVLPPCAESDAFLRETFAAWLKERSVNQPSLKLLIKPMRFHGRSTK